MQPMIAIKSDELYVIAGRAEHEDYDAMCDLRELEFPGVPRNTLYDKFEKIADNIIVLEEECIVGYARVLRNLREPLPFEQNYDFDTPQNLSNLESSRKAEIDYLIFKNFGEAEIIITAMLAAAVDMLKGAKIQSGYIVTKKQVKKFLLALNGKLTQIENLKAVDYVAFLPGTEDIASFAFLTEKLEEAIKNKAVQEGWQIISVKDVLKLKDKLLPLLL